MNFRQHEIGLVDDPGERDYYSICPNCSARILETGLESEIICTCCSHKFKSNSNLTLLLGDGEIEQRYLNKQEHERFKQRSASMRFSHPSNHQNYDFQENSKELEEEYEEEEEEDEDEEEKYESYDNPFGPVTDAHLYSLESDTSNNARSEIQQLNSQVKTLDTVTLLVIQETLLDDFIIKDKDEQNRELNNIGRVKDNANIVIKEETSIPDNLQDEEKEEEKEVVEEEPQIQGGPEERAAKNSLKSVKFELLIKQILLPFFQIQTRILQKGNIFEIGTIKFLVAATTPYKQGKVGTKTKIRCNMVVSQETPLESVELIPMRRNAIPSIATFMNDVVSPFLSSIKPKEIYTHKHAIIELDDSNFQRQFRGSNLSSRETKFLIKYSRPFFGYFTENTKVKIDDYAKALNFIRIAPIWKDERTCKEVNENFVEYEKYIRHQYLDIYFHSGLSRFVEKGETIFIENLEFFVNDCRPKNGYVDDRTHIEIQTGFTQENFKRKQIQADKNFARRLQSRESHRSQLYHISHALGRAANIDDPSQLSQFDQELLGATRQIGDDISHLRQRLHMAYNQSSRSKKKPASKSLVQSLPERTLTKRFLAEKKFDNEEAYIKCLICLEYYEEEENVKILPCIHYFHKGCIESWFTRGRTCPVCKWDITKEPDSSQFEEATSPATS